MFFDNEYLHLHNCIYKAMCAAQIDFARPRDTKANEFQLFIVIFSVFCFFFSVFFSFVFVIFLSVFYFFIFFQFFYFLVFLEGSALV